MTKKNGAGRIKLPDFRLYYKVIETKMVLTHTYGHLIFDKGGKNIQWGKDSPFSKWCWESRTDAHESVKLEHTLTPHTEINSKWLKVVNVRHNTIRVEIGRAHV